MNIFWTALASTYTRPLKMPIRGTRVDRTLCIYFQNVLRWVAVTNDSCVVFYYHQRERAKETFQTIKTWNRWVRGPAPNKRRHVLFDHATRFLFNVKI